MLDTLVKQEEDSAICISYLNLVVKLGVAFGAQEAERMRTVQNASKNPLLEPNNIRLQSHQNQVFEILHLFKFTRTAFHRNPLQNL